MPWTVNDITAVEIEPDHTDGGVVTIRVATPAGTVRIMGQIDIEGRTLVVKGAHIQSDGGANAFGVVNLRVIALAVLERIDCDETRIEGAARTTGANPGHRPRVIRFTR